MNQFNSGFRSILFGVLSSITTLTGCGSSDAATQFTLEGKTGGTVPVLVLKGTQEVHNPSPAASKSKIRTDLDGSWKITRFGSAVNGPDDKEVSEIFNHPSYEAWLIIHEEKGKLSLTDRSRHCTVSYPFEIKYCCRKMKNIFLTRPNESPTEEVKPECQDVAAKALLLIQKFSPKLEGQTTYHHDLKLD